MTAGNVLSDSNLIEQVQLHSQPREYKYWIWPWNSTRPKNFKFIVHGYAYVVATLCCEQSTNCSFRFELICCHHAIHILSECTAPTYTPSNPIVRSHVARCKLNSNNMRNNVHFTSRTLNERDGSDAHIHTVCVDCVCGRKWVERKRKFLMTYSLWYYNFHIILIYGLLPPPHISYAGHLNDVYFMCGRTWPHNVLLQFSIFEWNGNVSTQCVCVCCVRPFCCQSISSLHTLHDTQISRTTSNVVVGQSRGIVRHNSYSLINAAHTYITLFIIHDMLYYTQ